ncbi:MAG: c-type cytochrome, partial [bacterium]|nr:c-type cytochrome [bacterium]
RVFAVVECNSQTIVIMRLLPHGVETVCRLSAPGTPNDLVWDEHRRELLATGIWSQRLYRWKLAANDSRFTQWTAREQADLPMCGGCILVLPEHQCTLVVDAFGRHYAVVGNSEFSVQHESLLYGHNVTGLAATKDESMVFFPHQLLNEFARSVRTDITWGGMMSNNIRWLQTERLLNQTGEQVFKKSKFYPLGSPGNGAGDPSSMAVSSAGRIAVTLGGTNRVAIGNEDDYYFRQVNVGYRPVDCAFSHDESLLYVVNQFSDSLSVIDLQSMAVQQISLGPLREPNEVEYGEQLFFNSRISHDGWMSCHSCHSQGHTNGQLNDNFSDGSYGTPKRVLSLLGQADTMPYAWSGKVDSLETQVGHSIRSTMAGDREPSPNMIRAIATYVAALASPPSLREARLEHGPSAEGQLERGRRLFSELGCADCHSGERLTSGEAYDVGLWDENGMRWFNPPSLVSVSQRQTSLLHDARAKSLRDVFEREQHQLSKPLGEQELDDLVRYLKSL